jgi:hypothetical protein
MNQFKRMSWVFFDVAPAHVKQIFTNNFEFGIQQLSDKLVLLQIALVRTLDLRRALRIATGLQK